MKPSLAFVDNIFHQYTKSADFFRELISADFDITNYWDKTSQKGSRVSVEEINQHEYVIFWQRLNPISDLKKIKAKMIWVPMYDSLNPDYLFWKNLSFIPIKVICFSEYIYKKCLDFGIEAVYLKYWVKPVQNEVDFKQRSRTFFFWNRGAVTFNEIKKIINPNSIDKFILLSRPDPNYQAESISIKDIEKYKIEKIEMDFKQSKEDYLNLVKSAGIFIAPRKKEGIGLSFIEAMSLGLIVVSYNEGTMNEYIRHGVNGYLFDEHTKEPVNFSKAEELFVKNQNESANGFKNWEKDSKNIYEFVKSPCTKRKSFLRIFWLNIYNLKLWQFKIRNRFF